MKYQRVLSLMMSACIAVSSTGIAFAEEIGNETTPISSQTMQQEADMDTAQTESSSKKTQETENTSEHNAVQNISDFSSEEKNQADNVNVAQKLDLQNQQTNQDNSELGKIINGMQEMRGESPNSGAGNYPQTTAQGVIQSAYIKRIVNSALIESEKKAGITNISRTLESEVSAEDILAFEMLEVKTNQYVSINLNSSVTAEEIKELQHFNRIDQIIIEKVRDVDMFDLAKIKGLRSLVIDNATLKNKHFHLIANLENFRLIGVSINNEDLKNLSKGIYSLEITGASLTDISELYDMTQLEYLKLGENKINDIEPLKNLKDLGNLEMPNNLVEDLSPLSKLEKLSVLNFDHNNISDLQPISNLSILHFLSLSENRIEDISPLLSLEKLQNVDISKNRIADVAKVKAQLQSIGAIDIIIEPQNTSKPQDNPTKPNLGSTTPNNSGSTKTNDKNYVPKTSDTRTSSTVRPDAGKKLDDKKKENKSETKVLSSENKKVETINDHQTPKAEAMSTSQKIKFKIGSKEVWKNIGGKQSSSLLSATPFIRNGRTMIPVRHAAEALGMEVIWDQANRTIIMRDGSHELKIPASSKKISSGEKTISGDVAPIIEGSRTYLSISNLVKAFQVFGKIDISWNPTTKEVTINKENAM